MLSRNEERRHALARTRKLVGDAGGKDATKADLAKIAEAHGVTVTRSDGKDGEPVKSDYLAALGF